MLWAAKRWEAAEVVELRIKGTVKAWHLPAEPCEPKNLQTALVKLGNFAFSESVHQPGLGDWLVRCLSRSCTLQCLALSGVIGKMSLPLTLKHLKHLQLVDAGIHFAASLDAISGLTLLQTLLLEGVVMFTHEVVFLDCPALSAAALHDLQCVSVRYLKPVDMALPPGCSLHVEGDADAVDNPFSDVEWTRHSLDRNLRAVKLHKLVDYLGDEDEVATHHLPPILADNGHFTSVQWSLDDGYLGSVAYPLIIPGGHFQALSYLCLHARYMNVVFPPLGLRTLHLYAQDINVSFEDPRALRLVECSIVYRNNPGNSMADLLVELCVQREPAAKQEITMLGDEPWFSVRLGRAAFCTGAEPCGCQCRCCLDCLRIAGAVNASVCWTTP